MPKNPGAMGRNPFGKKKHTEKQRHIKEVKIERVKTPARIERLSPRVADWLLIDVPAETYVLGLKTVLLWMPVEASRH